MSEEEIGLIEQSIHMQQSNSSLGNFSIVHVRLSSKSVLRSCFLELNMNASCKLEMQLQAKGNIIFVA